MTAHPPKRAVRLMRWSLPPRERQAVLGDLEEEFTAIQQSSSDRAARQWYWRQTIRSLWPNLKRRERADPRRQEHRRQGLKVVTTGWLWFSIGLVGRTAGASIPPFALLLGTMGILAGSAMLARALLLRPVSPKQITWAVVAAEVVGGALAVGLVKLTHSWPWPLACCALPAAVVLWRWQPKVQLPGGEFHVGLPDDTDAGISRLRVAVPYQPLGMSGLVLWRPTGAESAERPDSPPLVGDVIIGRLFSAAKELRVYAAVQASAATARATISIIDATGHIVRARPAPLASAEAIEWRAREGEDDLSKGPPVASLDTVVPLHDLSPGLYRLSLLVSDGTRSATREESLRVTDAAALGRAEA